MKEKGGMAYRGSALSQAPLPLVETKNAVLIDANRFAGLASRLERRFERADLTDLTSVFVDVVLRDRVWLVPQQHASQSDFQSQLVPWFKAGAMMPLPSGRNSLGHRRDFAKSPLRSNRLLAKSDELGLPITLIGNLNRPSIVLAQSIEHEICDLVGNVRRLQAAQMAAHFRNRIRAPRFMQFQIGPVALMVLKRCQRLEDLPLALSEVRDDFISERAKIRDLTAMMQDPSVSPDKRRREIRKCEAAWQALHMKAEGSTLVTFAQSGSYATEILASSIEGLVGYSAGEASGVAKAAASIIGNAIAFANDAFSERRNAWRLEGVYRALHDYDVTSDAEMVKHLKRLFGPPNLN